MQMLYCLSATDPTITDAERLYNDSNDSGALWLRNGSIPPCLSTSPPSPSDCVVCLKQGLHALCGKLVETKDLLLEDSHRHIETVESECSRLLSAGTTEWWYIFIPIFVIIAGLMIGYFIQKGREVTAPLNESAV